MLDFSQNLYTEVYSFKEGREAQPLATTRGDIPTSKQISGVEVRLSKAYIIDNKTMRFGPFPGLAKVYLMNIVVSDVNSAAIDINLNGFEKVDDKTTLAVDRTLFYWKKAENAGKPPSQIHIMTSLIKSKKALRDTAKIMEDARSDEGFKNLTGKIGKMLKNASDFTNISGLVFEAAGIVGKLLGKVEDKPLITRFQSFTDMAGNFNQLGKSNHPFSNRYAEIDYAVYIRDQARLDEEEA
jgi:hypothetical protein